ncbi:bacterial leucyl aminopeptidase-like [Ptychodera flava]|uniref:bacterial leucyl aminopeptidase-like n=1 Tax=Ptychodera flava TaxID=63121 RepID=UPI00396A1B66
MAALHDIEPLVQVFIANNVQDEDIDYTGENIVGILAGERTGTVNDKVVLMGAHYDTTSDTPGVDDNGSGVSALLEAARMVTSRACKPKNTILFVAFDLEEMEDENEFESGFLGSKHFVDEWLQEFLNGDSNSRSQFQGALIMDTIMNYNKVINTQKYPDEILTSETESEGGEGDREALADDVASAVTAQKVQRKINDYAAALHRKQTTAIPGQMRRGNTSAHQRKCLLLSLRKCLTMSCPVQSPNGREVGKNQKK